MCASARNVNIPPPQPSILRSIQHVWGTLTSPPPQPSILRTSASPFSPHSTGSHPTQWHSDRKSHPTKNSKSPHRGKSWWHSVMNKLLNQQNPILKHWRAYGFAMQKWSCLNVSPNGTDIKRRLPPTMLLTPGLSHITRRKVTSPNVNARWRKVTSHGGKSHHFVTIPMAQRRPTENRKVTNLAATLRTVRYLLILGRSLHRIPKRESPCNVPLGLTLPNGTPALRPKTRQDLASADKSAKPKVHCTQQQTTAENEESQQNTAGTQANYESTKNANESAKATKVLRTSYPLGSS